MMRLVLLCGLVGPGVAAMAVGADAAPPSTRTVFSLRWLSGDWIGRMPGGTFSAHYTAAESGKIISYSVLRKDDQVVFHEFEVFEREGDHVRLRPFPGGKPATALTLVTVDTAARRAVFENLNKDFPTRIAYECPTTDQLVITLSDPQNAPERREVFELRRVP